MPATVPRSGERPAERLSQVGGDFAIGCHSTCFPRHEVVGGWKTGLATRKGLHVADSLSTLSHRRSGATHESAPRTGYPGCLSFVLRFPSLAGFPRFSPRQTLASVTQQTDSSRQQSVTSPPRGSTNWPCFLPLPAQVPPGVEGDFRGSACRLSTSI